MPKRVLIGAALVLIGAAGTFVLVVRQHRVGTSGVQASYTALVKARDIVDSSRNCYHALNDAELRAENYVLTGETVYYEAYLRDMREWQDESGTLDIIARRDQAGTAARDFIKAGQRTMDELAAVISIYDKLGRDQAIERIRRSSSIVYLDQAHEHLNTILTPGARDTLGTRMVTQSVVSSRRLFQFSSVSFALTLAALLLLMLEARRS